MSGSEDEAAPVTKAEFGRLLTAMIGIQDQMQSMKRELAEERDAANEPLVKRIRLEKAPLHSRRRATRSSFVSTKKSVKRSRQRRTASSLLLRR